MRFAFVVSSSIGYQIDSLYQNESSFDEFAKALHIIKQQGFGGVELNLNFDDQRKLSRIKRAINDSGLKLAAIGTGLLYARDRLSFTDQDFDKRTKALSIVKNLIHFASGEHAVVIIGLVRGSPSTRDEATEERLRESLMQCDREAKENGIRIALEAINRYETNLLNTASDAVTLIEKEKLAATGLLLDTFHMNIEEQSICDTIRNAAPRIVHFHIADSNRWPPGHGHLKIDDLLRILEDSGYTEWVSAETLPRPNNTKAVTETAEFLKTHKFI
jgi:sugar phosphate isomerase/epimerase